jgi:hypothetical protein
MIRALLAGTKTQTRRIIKGFDQRDVAGAFQSWGLQRRDTFYLWPNAREQVLEFCPCGRLGDLLWVRETWHQIGLLGECTGPEHIRFAASVGEAEWATTKWRPSIFLPRWASRLTLRITDVRAERLQTISYEDAIAEGCGLSDMRFEPIGDGETWEQTARRLRWPQRTYEDLWNAINGIGSWNANSWVWALTFEVIHQNVDQVLASTKAAA